MKRILISEEEKKRILGMHLQNGYKSMTEQAAPAPAPAPAQGTTGQAAPAPAQGTTGQATTKVATPTNQQKQGTDIPNLALDKNKYNIFAAPPTPEEMVKCGFVQPSNKGLGQSLFALTNMVLGGTALDRWMAGASQQLPQEIKNYYLNLAASGTKYYNGLTQNIPNDAAYVKQIYYNNDTAKRGNSDMFGRAILRLVGTRLKQAGVTQLPKDVQFCQA